VNLINVEAVAACAAESMSRAGMRKKIMAAKRAIMRIQLDASAKGDLDKFCDKRGMTQIAVMSRLVSWFVHQDDMIQSSVMGSLSEGSFAKLAKQLLKNLASHKENSK
jgi:hypothetical protein